MPPEGLLRCDAMPRRCAIPHNCTRHAVGGQFGESKGQISREVCRKSFSCIDLPPSTGMMFRHELVWKHDEGTVALAGAPRRRVAGARHRRRLTSTLQNAGVMRSGDSISRRVFSRDVGGRKKRPPIRREASNRRSVRTGRWVGGLAVLPWAGERHGQVRLSTSWAPPRIVRPRRRCRNRQYGVLR